MNSCIAKEEKKFYFVDDTKKLILRSSAPKIALFLLRFVSLSHIFNEILKLTRVKRWKNSSKKIRKCDFERRNVFTDNVHAFNYHCRHFMLVKGL